MIVEENAVMTVENGLERPDFSMEGTSIFASIAASALVEPLMPPISVDRRILA